MSLFWVNRTEIMVGIDQITIGKIKENTIHVNESWFYGAPGHTGVGNNYRLRLKGAQDAWDIRFNVQPAQSPDLNIMDLCFFTH